MHLSSIFSLLAIPACLASTLRHDSHHVKRGSETDATLYAYGTSTNGWPIAYGSDDGLLYIAESPNNNSSKLTPLTWDLPSITDECWIANASFVNGTRAGSLFIKPEDEYALGVLPITRVAYINGTVSGFALFASQLVYNNNTELEAQFWAATTDTDGLYKLVWNANGVVSEGDFPVVVKGSED
ncbi:hypothetical protein BDV59DRAFT_175434 [Aspergillus ambiguus]|uniref:uncharacterized protein n=1 Tax=Aspergillus ambiguus TaxID=176160 RepID=UPI003CCD9BF7